MSNDCITTMKVRWSPPPGSVETASAGRLPSPATAALAGAWLGYGAALVLPAAQYTSGFECLVGTLGSILLVCVGGVGALHPASLVIPNLFMFLSPLVLFAAMRRGRGMRFLRAGSVAGAVLALSFPVSLLFHPFMVESCGGMPAKAFEPEIGTYVWVASQILLAAALVLIGKAACTPR